MPLVVLLWIVPIAICLAAEKKVVGILEFEEQTPIDQDNAGVVIPELLISYLKQIGHCTLSERVFLKKTLEEQEL